MLLINKTLSSVELRCKDIWPIAFLSSLNETFILELDSFIGFIWRERIFDVWNSASSSSSIIYWIYISISKIDFKNKILTNI